MSSRDIDRLGPSHVLTVGSAVGQAAVENADQTVAESSQSLVVRQTTGTQGVIATAGAS